MRVRKRLFAPLLALLTDWPIGIVPAAFYRRMIIRQSKPDVHR